jgi:hypothetical protein
MRLGRCGLDGSDELPAARPSMELVGALYTLADDVELYANQVLKDAKRIREAAREAFVVREEFTPQEEAA